MKNLRKALFTYVRNESIILPLWFKHHLKHFEASDIYVLDNDSTDDGVESLLKMGLPEKNIVKIPIPQDQEFTCKWLNNVASEFQHTLIKTGYDWTILAESDEFIDIDVEICPGGWDELLFDLQRAGISNCRALGYDVIHDITSEATLDFAKPILSQRKKARLWTPELNGGKMLFSKPVLASVPTHWHAGGHNLTFELTTNTTVQIDNRLLLFHLNLCDFEFSAKRRSARVPTGQTKINGDRLFVGQQLIDEINKNLASPAIRIIPEKFKNLL